MNYNSWISDGGRKKESQTTRVWKKARMFRTGNTRLGQSFQEIAEYTLDDLNEKLSVSSIGSNMPKGRTFLRKSGRTRVKPFHCSRLAGTNHEVTVLGCSRVLQGPVRPRGQSWEVKGDADGGNRMERCRYTVLKAGILWERWSTWTSPVQGKDSVE